MARQRLYWLLWLAILRDPGCEHDDLFHSPSNATSCDIARGQGSEQVQNSRPTGDVPQKSTSLQNITQHHCASMLGILTLYTYVYIRMTASRPTGINNTKTPETCPWGGWRPTVNLDHVPDVLDHEVQLHHVQLDVAHARWYPGRSPSRWPAPSGR